LELEAGECGARCPWIAARGVCVGSRGSSTSSSAGWSRRLRSRNCSTALTPALVRTFSLSMGRESGREWEGRYLIIGAIMLPWCGTGFGGPGLRGAILGSDG
jgi:hypothetical protein